MADGDLDTAERDFLVSYQQADRAWAEWIAWQVEEMGHSVLFQGWDFVPGTNWIKRMQDGVSHSARVIVVLSPAYTGSMFGAAEWQAIWASDPDGAERRVIPVRIADCERPGLLAGIVSIDLFDVPEPKARQRLRDAIRRARAGRAKPLSPPSFPATTAGPAGTATAPVSREARPAADAAPPEFPGRHRHIEVRGGQGVQIGDGNIQINRW